MLVTFSVVPPGGGEQAYSFEVDLPALPERGDYVTGWDGQDRARYFIVRRRWFYLDVEEQEHRSIHTHREIVVEVELARGPVPSKGHRRRCQVYESQGKVPQEFDSSTY
jgi:hypothetical protein